MIKRFWSQLFYLIRKVFISKWRRKTGTFLEMSMVLYFFAVLCIVKKVVEPSNKPEIPESQIRNYNIESLAKTIPKIGYTIKGMMFPSENASLKVRKIKFLMLFY